MSETNLSISSEKSLTLAGQAANRAAARHVFDDYRARKAENTLRRQRADLELFRLYLADVSVNTGDLGSDPESWRGMTWGLVTGFVGWQLARGYAVRSINVRLSTVKAYAKLALQAGALDNTEHALIRTVTGYANKEAKHVDEKRENEGVPTRYPRPGAKKPKAVKIGQEQAAMLKNAHPDTPQGRRDRLLMCILLDHGLRVGEVAQLTVGNFDLIIGQMTFYRPKVDKEQTHTLSRDTKRALKAWFESGDAPLSADAPLLRGSRKNGMLIGAGMSERAITQRVRELGKWVGIEGLSAHDCRHYWASYWAGKVDTFRLQEAGGWNSLAMPRRYVEQAKIANEGME